MPNIVDTSLFNRMITLRREIHRFPELAYHEEKTAELICRELDLLGIDYQKGIGNTGIQAVLGKQNGPCIGLRADMDALPVPENTGLDFSSNTRGVMHACGHDGHVAMLLGAAHLLKKTEGKERVVLLFQPAEESGNGAVAMINEGCLQDIAMVFCGHIDIHYPVATFTVDEGLICSYTDPFTITIQGQGGHAAKPHEAVDALVAASSLVMNLQTLVSRSVNPVHPAVVTVGQLLAGETHNVIAHKAVLTGTIRTAHKETREHLIGSMHTLIQGAAKMTGTAMELRLHDGLPAVINDKRSCAVARKAAYAVAGEKNVFSQGAPSLGGEDFSFYQQHVSGTMIRFGAAKKESSGPAHSSTFDFDENVLSYGASWLATVARLGAQSLSHR